MTWDAKALTARLARAVDTFDRDRAAELCRGLIDRLRRSDEAYPLRPAKTLLRKLRRKRYFELIQRVADALIQNGQDAPEIRCQYAQSQLDQGNLTAAIETLDRVVADAAVGSAESAEAKGLLGRAYKQLYLDAGEPGRDRSRRHLDRAVAWYRDVYDSDRAAHLWHGINTVALLRRAERDRVALERFPAPGPAAAEIASEILDAVEDKHLNQEARPWDLATAVEACIGLEGRGREAVKWLSLYLTSGYTDAFELASTYRQLADVWQLRADEPPGDRILPALKSALLRCEGSEIEISRDEAAREKLGQLAADAGFEKVLGVETFKSLKWFKVCMDRARAVARVETQFGDAIGTGFLVRGGDLAPRFGDEPLFLTNAHVISDHPQVRQAFDPGEAILDFELWDGRPPEIKVAEVLFSSPPADLDATLVRLSRPIDLQPLPIASTLPPADGAERAYIIGHPRGRKLSFSIHDNYLLDADETLLHYRSPTEPGSSGSPVFNDRWELIGLHHAGLQNMPRLHGQEGTYAANEGIRIQAIIERLGDGRPGG